MTKKPIVAYCIADNRNLPYYEMMRNSLRKFHSEKELPLILYGEKEIKATNDPMIFYRSTPYFARHLLTEYECALKIDADSVVLGNLDHIINDNTYDIGTVLNWNRIDPQTTGPVQVWNIPPTAYFNCGFVAMRSKAFVEKWWQLCMSNHFMAYQYREQDLLNILAYYFDWNVYCFDTGNTWNGLISKGEFNKFIVRNNQIIAPKQADKFPDKDMVVKIIHMAGGNMPNKMNYYRNHCSEEVITFIDNLVK